MYLYDRMKEFDPKSFELQEAGPRTVAYLNKYQYRIYHINKGNPIIITWLDRGGMLETFLRDHKLLINGD